LEQIDISVFISDEDLIGNLLQQPLRLSRRECLEHGAHNTSPKWPPKSILKMDPILTSVSKFRGLHHLSFCLSQDAFTGMNHVPTQLSAMAFITFFRSVPPLTTLQINLGH
jgi:hypothetical protein